jgi:hypothetical protein
MSPRRTASAHRPAGGGRVAVTAVLVAVIAICMVFLVRAKPGPEAFDPRSNRDDGTRALVLLLQQQGAVVDITRAVPPLVAEERVLVLSDRLDGGQRSDLLDLVEAGGVAVVADPMSSLHGGPGVEGGSVVVTGRSPAAPLPQSATIEANVAAGVCTIGALQHLRGVFVPSGLLFPVAPDEPQCMSDGRHAFVVRRTVGAGTIVGLGDNHVFTNAEISYADNSGLATALLAPVPGSRVAILLGSAAAKAPEDLGSGDRTLADLVRPGVWMAFAQLAAAFVMFAVAVGVRAGRAVSEPRPVPLDGSELVRATGAMMRRARHHDRAAWMLRTELHRELCSHYRLDHTSDPSIVARVAAVRDGLDTALVQRALTATADDDEQLLAVARDVALVRSQTIVGVPTQPQGAPP